MYDDSFVKMANFIAAERKNEVNALSLQPALIESNLIDNAYRNCCYDNLITIEGLYDTKKQDLKSKAASFMKSVGAYEGYEILCKGLSIEDM